jgi:hypothetical protein
MADIKQAIEYAKQNPNSPFANELRSRIERGEMNKELKAAGLGTPSSKTSISGDQSVVGAGLQAGIEATRNLPKSALNFAKNTVSSVTHPIQTLQGVGNTVLGGVNTAAEKLTGKALRTDQAGQTASNTFGAVTSALNDRYGSLEALQKTATTDPFAFGADVVGALQGGAGLAGKTAQLNNVLSKTARAATLPVTATTKSIGTVASSAGKAAGNLAGQGVPKLLSYTSDVPEQAFKTMLERREPVVSAIKEGVGAKEALTSTQGAVRNLRKTLSNEWQEGVTNIAEEFNTKRLGLNDKSAQALQNLSNEFGFKLPSNIKSASATEWIDTLKSINELPKAALSFSPKGAKVRRAKEALMDAVVKNFGGNEGSVAKLYKNYAAKKQVFDAANEIVSAYATGKPIKQTTAMNRLQNIFDENKPAYLEAIMDLEKATGQDILSGITASKFQSRMPGSFNRVSSAGGMATPKSVMEKGINLLAIPLTSPRFAGLIARSIQKPSLGKVGETASQVGEIASDINNFRVPSAFVNSDGQLKMGLSIEDVSKRPGFSPQAVKSIHPDDLSVMEKFIDDARGVRRMNDAEYGMAEKLANLFGINMDDGLVAVAKEFENILTGAKSVKGTIPKGSTRKSFRGMEGIMQDAFEGKI